MAATAVQVDEPGCMKNSQVLVLMNQLTHVGILFFFGFGMEQQNGRVPDDNPLPFVNPFRTIFHTVGTSPNTAFLIGSGKAVY